MFKTLFGQLKGYKRTFFITPVFSAFEVVFEVMIPFVIALLIDEGIEAGNMGGVVKWSLVMIVLAAAASFCGMMSGKFGAEASVGFAGNLRDAMYDRIQAFSFANIDRFSTSGLVTRMTTDVQNVQMACQMMVRIVVRAPLTILASIVMCLTISPSLSMIFVVALICLAIVLVLGMTTVMPIFDQVFDKYDALNESVQENVTAIRVVKAFVKEDYEDEKFKTASGNIYKMFVRAEGIMALANPMLMLVLYGCIIALSWFGAHYVVAGTITTGNLTSLFGYTMQMLMSLMMLMMVFVMMTMALASAKRIYQVFTEEPDIVNPESPVYEVADGSIDFDHVSFSYKTGTGDYVLEDIDLHIRAGETVGIIGGTGSGKTSLVNLISRLYDVNEGAVRVGGRDVRDYDIESLRNKVAVVLQKNELFSGTLGENLQWGKEDATEDEMRHACEIAGAWEFVSRLEDGFDLQVEQGGTNFSGGQKQRLCIARALLKDPKVLILDDSTSAVDTATDARIQHALTYDLPEMTKIVISQRVSSLASADRIIVLDDGRVNGFGTHEELMETNVIYREIYEQQTSGGGAGDFDEAAMGKDGE